MSENRAWLVIMRLAIGAVWLFQAYPKFREPYLSGIFTDRVSAMAANNPWHFYSTFLKTVVLPHASVFGYLTLIGDALVGLCLVLGLLTPYAGFVAIVLNINYGLAAGWMNRTDYSLNGLLLVLELIVIGFGAGKMFSLDAALSSSKAHGRRGRYLS